MTSLFLTRYLRVFLLALISLLLLPGLALASTYVVSPGDSLYKISNKYGVSISSIKSANGLTSNTIYVRQKLNINDVHYVKKGDTLYLIGKKFGVTAGQITNANGLKSASIYPGQKLTIPAKAGASNGVSAPVSTSRGGGQYSVSRSDFEVLARIITAEADSESYTAKVAVGAVILNRVKSSKFPNSIPAVVYQVDSTGRYQFEPVLNGWINRPASQSCIKAAQDAVNGWDPSEGALYFFEKDVTNKYLRSLPVTTVIDSFIFAR